MPEPEGETPEAAGPQQYDKLIQMLRTRYPAEKEDGRSSCGLCGKRSSHLRQMGNGLLLCEVCRNSEVHSIDAAAELLYTTYGSFKRLFPQTRFRYPNLKMSRQSMHQINNIAHREPNMSGLVEIVNDENDGFALCIVYDIPYGFLEELYAQAFSMMLEKDVRRSKSENTKTWNKYLNEYLENVGRRQQEKP